MPPMQGMHAESFSRSLFAIMSLAYCVPPSRFFCLFIFSRPGLCSASLSLFSRRGKTWEGIAPRRFRTALYTAIGFPACGSEASCYCLAGDLRRPLYWRATKLRVFPFSLSNCRSKEATVVSDRQERADLSAAKGGFSPCVVFINMLHHNLTAGQAGIPNCFAPP